MFSIFAAIDRWESALQTIFRETRRIRDRERKTEGVANVKEETFESPAAMKRTITAAK